MSGWDHLGANSERRMSAQGIPLYRDSRKDECQEP